MIADRKIWLLIEQGDTPMVNSVTASREHAELIAQQHNTEPIEVVEVENTEDAFDIQGDQVSFVLQAIDPTPESAREGQPEPTAHFSDEDTAELIVFDDGSIYTWDEKGAITVDKEGRVLSTYWRGDDEPFDIRQVIWHDTYSAEDLEVMTGPTRLMTEAMSAASYDAIHYTSERASTAAIELAKVVQAALAK